MSSRRKRKGRTPVKKTTFGVIDLTAGPEVIIIEDDDNVVVKKTAISQAPAVSHELQELLNQAAFYLPLTFNSEQQPGSSKVSAIHGEIIGKFSLYSRDGVQLPKVRECWLYVSTSLNGCHFLYQEQNPLLPSHFPVRFGSPAVGFLLADVAVGMYESQPSNDALKLLFCLDECEQLMEVQLLLDKKSVCKLDGYKGNKIVNNRALYSIQAGLMLAGYAPLPDFTDKISVGAPHMPSLPSFRHNIPALFKEIKKKQYMDEEITPKLEMERDEVVDRDESRRLLLDKLRPYQREAIRWMIAKERGLYTDAYNKDMQGLFTRLPNTDLYVNSDSGIVTSQPPQFSLLPGGVLADEMGLGKTVEVLTCMLCNPRKDIPSTKALVSKPSAGPFSIESVGKEDCMLEDKPSSTSSSSDMKIADLELSNSSGQDGLMEKRICNGYTTHVNNSQPPSPVQNGALDLDVSVVRDDTMNPNADSPLVEKNNSKMTAASPSVENTVDLKLSPNPSVECGTGVEEQTTPSHLQTDVDAGSLDGQHAYSTEKALELSADEIAMGVKFECTCGTDAGDMVKVQCCLCNLQQHAKCVMYDVTDVHREPYKCPHCHVISEPIKSGATLIVAPASIKHQWREEINKHVGSSHLKMLEYEGVGAKKYIQPMTLARQDIVITTYDVLKTELRATNVPHSNSDMGRQFRQPKRFMALPSPLPAVEWWRICLDEAQMVESVTTRTSEMVLKLSAVNRWCVTGTPINSGVSDLYGLILFLGVAPLALRTAWQAFAYRPYCFGKPNNLFTAMRHVMWRTCKADVRDQLGLPPQTEVMHEVMFSPVEELFYRDQYGWCKSRCLKIMEKIGNKETRLDSLSRHDLTDVMNSLLHMRQACCHAEIAREKGRLGHAPKHALTINELHTHMTSKVKVQCEEAYRCIAAALNGQAGCHLLMGNRVDAIEKYWQVLNPTDEYSHIKTDTLQLIHASHNLRDVIASHGPHPAIDIDVKRLEEAQAGYEEKYLVKLTSTVVDAFEEYKQLDSQISPHELMSESLQDSGWWSPLLTPSSRSMLRDGDTTSGLLHHVHNAVCHSRKHQRITSVTELSGLAYTLYDDWRKLVNCHTESMHAIVKLNEYEVRPDVVAGIVACCLRPDGTGSVSSCHFCKTEEILIKNETSLFDSYNTFDSVSQIRSRWADSAMELAFKALISYMRLSISSKPPFSPVRAMLAGCIEKGNDHVKLIEDMKKQFKVMRALWRHLRDRLAAVDELAMAKTRFRLRLEAEPSTNSLEVVEEHDVEMLFHKQVTDQACAKEDFDAATRQLKYLQHISALPIDEVNGNTELCPICQMPLGHSWAVLSCCHSFCINCMQVLAGNSLEFSTCHRNVVKCALCRTRTRKQDVSYVSSGKVVSSANQGIDVKGNYSSKVMEVVRCLKVIERDTPDAKALVFSTWNSLLEVVAIALSENNITYQLIGSQKQGKRYESKLNSFRCHVGIEALLLPISSGANGLNLTEATHVLLLEPLLHYGKEAQAIGRIHRIGQTKPTYVHRFIVKHTIEEQLHSMLSSRPPGETEETDGLSLTLSDLRAMFSASD